MITIEANGVQLPSPDELSSADEIIWSSNTGRNTSGDMVGDVVAEKTTFTIRWGIISRSDYKKIKQNIRTGFHPFTIRLNSETITINSYRGTLSAGTCIYAGGEVYHKDASVTIIQQ